MEHCRRTIAEYPRRRCVAQSLVNDITWTVWVAGPSVDESAESAPIPFSLFVSMSGRPQLKNYILRVEKTNVAATPDEYESDAEFSRRLRADLALRCEIVQRDNFAADELLRFPLPKPDEWFNDEGDLDIIFKVRPINYLQKCQDLEIYIQSLKESTLENENDSSTNCRNKKRKKDDKPLKGKRIEIDF